MFGGRCVPTCPTVAWQRAVAQAFCARRVDRQPCFAALGMGGPAEIAHRLRELEAQLTKAFNQLHARTGQSGGAAAATDAHAGAGAGAGGDGSGPVAADAGAELARLVLLAPRMFARHLLRTAAAQPGRESLRSLLQLARGTFGDGGSGARGGGASASPLRVCVEQAAVALLESGGGAGGCALALLQSLWAPAALPSSTPAAGAGGVGVAQPSQSAAPSSAGPRGPALGPCRPLLRASKLLDDFVLPQLWAAGRALVHDAGVLRHLVGDAETAPPPPPGDDDACHSEIASPSSDSVGAALALLERLLPEVPPWLGFPADPAGAGGRASPGRRAGAQSSLSSREMVLRRRVGPGQALAVGVISNTIVGLVIGKGGSTIRALQEASGLALLQTQRDDDLAPGASEREVYMVGSEAARATAQRYLERIAAGQLKPPPEVQVNAEESEDPSGPAADATAGEEEASATAASAEQDADHPGNVEARKCFVGNLPYRVDDGAIRHFFQDCGAEVVDVQRLLDERSGKFYGSAFVVFAAAAAVPRALALAGRKLQGRKIKVGLPKPTSTSVSADGVQRAPAIKLCANQGPTQQAQPLQVDGAVLFTDAKPPPPGGAYPLVGVAVALENERRKMKRRVERSHSLVPIIQWTAALEAAQALFTVIDSAVPLARVLMLLLASRGHTTCILRDNGFPPVRMVQRAASLLQRLLRTLHDSDVWIAAALGASDAPRRTIAAAALLAVASLRNNGVDECSGSGAPSVRCVRRCAALVKEVREQLRQVGAKLHWTLQLQLLPSLWSDAHLAKSIWRLGQGMCCTAESCQADGTQDGASGLAVQDEQLILLELLSSWFLCAALDTECATQAKQSIQLELARLRASSVATATAEVLAAVARNPVPLQYVEQPNTSQDLGKGMLRHKCCSSRWVSTVQVEMAVRPPWTTVVTVQPPGQQSYVAWRTPVAAQQLTVPVVVGGTCHADLWLILTDSLCPLLHLYSFVSIVSQMPLDSQISVRNVHTDAARRLEKQSDNAARPEMILARWAMSDDMTSRTNLTGDFCSLSRWELVVRRCEMVV